MSRRARCALVLAGAAMLAATALGAQQPQRPAARPAPGRQAAPSRDTTRADSGVAYMREVFSYQGGTRDPFQTLITSSEVRPTIEDLRLVSVVYDARYGNSVAVVREEGNPRPHRLRRGNQIGRLRVIQIRQHAVVFQVEEFGFERQEVLSLSRPEANQP
ncbi:MAG: hypothetical protein HYR48_07530 [Gemmatimonadetes bacterium]|nr:hypothetical protein [Gemmatimonadota bacterium]